MGSPDKSMIAHVFCATMPGIGILTVMDQDLTYGLVTIYPSIGERGLRYRLQCKQ